MPFNHFLPVSEALRRVLEPIDPWLDKAQLDGRLSGFRGTYDEISCFAETICREVRGLAAYYGSRRRMIPQAPAVFRFSTEEVETLGGQVVVTPSEPPWPPDYRDSHRDLTGDIEAVTTGMVQAYDEDPVARRGEHSREDILREICVLLTEDPPKSFTTQANWILRKLFDHEREAWDRLSSDFPGLREEPTIAKKLRVEADMKKSSRR